MGSSVSQCEVNVTKFVWSRAEDKAGGHSMAPDVTALTGPHSWDYF